MQQTKRRSKKGVILLALAIALLVVAIVPAAAMAAPAVLKADLAPLGLPGQGGHNWVYDTPTTGTFSATLDPGTGVFAASPANFVQMFIWNLDGGPGLTVAANTAAGASTSALLWTALDVSDGLHTINYWAETTQTAGTPPGLPQEPIQHQTFGVDDIKPVWSVVQSPAEPASTWYGKVSVNFTATASDPGGSGVAAASAAWINFSFPASSAVGVPLPYDQWTKVVTGTVTPPVVAGGADTTTVSLVATDVVGNVGTSSFAKKFDITPPATTYAISPVGADTNAGWTNQDVTLTFTAVDPYLQSGVNYTEYVVKTSTSTATPAPPALTDSGIKGTSVKITQTAPVGPVYVWYRSVDNAVPANLENWHLVMVFIDKNAPILSDNAPSWWINDGTSGSNFWVDLYAVDSNSGLGAGEIMAQMPTWFPPLDGINAADWKATDGYVGLWVDHVAHTTDGIFPLNYKATDMAGNIATASTQVKIDTRAPVTDGASGWINGLVPYVLTGTDQASGAGVAATIYRVDQSTPWLINVATTVGPTLDSNITIPGAQGSVHTVDFGSVDAALPAGYNPVLFPLIWPGPSYTYGNLEGVTWSWVYSGSEYRYLVQSFVGYKTRSVKLDITAPVVTAMDPKNGEWQKGPATVNFSGTDVGSGYAHTEWSTDGGTTWKTGEVAQIGGNGEITVTYRGVDNVGIKSANQTIVVKVASIAPTVKGANASVKRGHHKVTFKFNVTATTPKVSVTIQIRTRSGVTVSTHHYNNVTANAAMSRAFWVNMKKGKYNIRIGAVDQAGNVQTMLGTGTLTVK